MRVFRVWIHLVRREGLEFVRNRAGWIMPLLPPFLAWVVVRPASVGRSSGAWEVASWLLFAAVMPGVMLASASLAEERDRGTWKALRMAPVSVMTVLSAKVWLVGALAMLSEGLLWALTPHMGIAIPWAPMILGAGFGAFAGLILALIADSQRSASALAAVVMVVLFVSALVYPDLPHVAFWLAWMPSVAWVHLCDAAIVGHRVPVRPALILGGWIVIMLGIGMQELHRQLTQG